MFKTYIAHHVASVDLPRSVNVIHVFFYIVICQPDYRNQTTNTTYERARAPDSVAADWSLSNAGLTWCTHTHSDTQVDGTQVQMEWNFGLVIADGYV